MTHVIVPVTIEGLNKKKNLLGAATRMLTDNDIKSELSYAYLHAIAARAGFSCVGSNRHLDNAGVDAQLHVTRRFHAQSVLTDFDLNFQLKATSQAFPIVEGAVSFPLPVAQYDKLRETRVLVPRFLVLFMMPAAPQHWLNVSADSLVARRCALWVSLLGLPASPNTTSVTVSVPEVNVLTPAALENIGLTISMGGTFQNG